MRAQDQIARFVRKLVAPLERRVRVAIARGIVELVNDTTRCQTLQVSVRSDELRDDAEHFQQFGFTSHPPVGSEAVVLSVGGASDHPIVVAVEDRNTRPTDLAEGESAQYTAQDGKRVYCKSDGTVNLGTEPDDFVALAPVTLSEHQAVLAELNTLKAAIAAAAGTEAGAGGLGGMTALNGALSAWPAWTPASVAATEVKAK